MRNIHELLKQFKGYIEVTGLSTGLCHEANLMFSCGHIYLEEWVLLRRFIKDNRPKECSDVYWYPEGEVEPRIAWLDKHIRKTRPSFIVRLLRGLKKFKF